MRILNELRKHQKLEGKRNPMYEKNRFGKFFMYFVALSWAAYLMLFGMLLKFAFQEEFPNMEPYHILNKGLIILLFIDFIIRFIFQKPPTQEIKPYLLLPIGKKKLLNFLLAKSLLLPYNLLWFFLLIPFATFSISRFYGFQGLFLYLLGCWLLILANNYWYLICRTLISNKPIYILLPILFYSSLLGSEFLSKHAISNLTMNLGEGFIIGNPLSFIPIIGLIGILWFINRFIIINNIYAELARTKDTHIKSISDYKFLDSYGETGEYIRLELKLLFRNKRPKLAFLMGVFGIAVLFALQYFIPDQGVITTNFVYIYSYYILGTGMLSQIMSFEGNYIDGLMSRKESIYSLLKAKYYFYSLCIIIPFLLAIPLIISGQISWLMSFSYSFFTIGFVYLMVFQLAIYNNKTTIFDENAMTSRGSVHTGFETLTRIGVFTLPILIISITKLIFGETIGLWILLIIGVIFTITSHFWIKNVYKRFMKRRYINMEGFRNSR